MTDKRVSNSLSSEDIQSMSWFYLAWDCGFEMVFAIALKYSDGYSKLVPNAIALFEKGDLQLKLIYNNFCGDANGLLKLR